MTNGAVLVKLNHYLQTKYSRDCYSSGHYQLDGEEWRKKSQYAVHEQPQNFESRDPTFPKLRRVFKSHLKDWLHLNFCSTDLAWLDVPLLDLCGVLSFISWHCDSCVFLYPWRQFVKMSSETGTVPNIWQGHSKVLCAERKLDKDIFWD
jgi:hypothetical protein